MSNFLSLIVLYFGNSISIEFFVSFHEMGVYDLPAMISYITNTNSQPLYAYIGHSMGTTASYVMAAERPEIARKVRMIISLAPTAFLKHMKSPIRFLTPFAKNIQVKYENI